MRAMSKLPSSEKERMLPIVLLAPWLNSIEFENTHRIIKNSIGSSPIIVDIDRYFHSNSDLPSRTYFKSLLDGDSGAQVWMDLIENHDNYIPTIQIMNVSDALISAQINQANSLGRGLVLRIDPLTQSQLGRVMKIVSSRKNDDILIVLDFGYRDDLLSTAAEISGLIRSIIEISTELKIVISGASFPNEFSEFNDFGSLKAINERAVFSEIIKNFGNYQIFYGDWSSTKPRRYDGGGSRPLPRIDFPTRSNWIIARSKDQQWSFQQAAERVTRLPDWEYRPLVWGSGMIEKTAQGLPGGISTGPESIAARVNIHLYVQNHFGDTGQPSIPEGDWIDPI